MQDDPTLPTTSDIIVVFLKSIIALNSRRKGTALPDLYVFFISFSYGMYCKNVFSLLLQMS